MFVRDDLRVKSFSIFYPLINLYFNAWYPLICICLHQSIHETEREVVLLKYSQVF